MLKLKLPFNLVDMILTIIRSIFVQERTNKTGPEKEEAVLTAANPKMASAGSWLDYLKYFYLLSGLIKIIIKYLNDNLGKDWGKENDANKK